MSHHILNEVKCLPSEWRDYVDNLPGQSLAQQAHLQSETARVDGELTARYDARGREMEADIAEQTAAVQQGWAEVARAYQDAESAYELGDITLPEFRGRIQALARREGRLREQMDDLETKTELAEQHAAIRPVEYTERLLRKMPRIERPTYYLRPKKSSPDFSSPI